jgi:hypothetical protein
VAIGRDDHFDPSRRGPVFFQQTAQDCPKVVANLHLPQLAGSVLSYLIGFSDRLLSHVSPFPGRWVIYHISKLAARLRAEKY